MNYYRPHPEFLPNDEKNTRNGCLRVFLLFRSYMVGRVQDKVGELLAIERPSAETCEDSIARNLLDF